jgi:excisionase family DNA binding protein
MMSPKPTKGPQPKLAYSVKETVGLTGISRARLYKEIKAGRLRIVKSGKRTLILAEALADSISSLSNATAAA